MMHLHAPIARTGGGLSRLGEMRWHALVRALIIDIKDNCCQPTTLSNF